MLRTDDLDYELPPGLIATVPALPRDSARLMVVRRGDAGYLRHARVADLPGFLSQNDLLVLNRTRVLPARFRGVRSDSGGKVDGLYLGPGGPMGVRGPEPDDREMIGGKLEWSVLLKSRRAKPGVIVRLYDRDGGDGHAGQAHVSLRLLEKRAGPEEGGEWIVAVEGVHAGAGTIEVLGRVGLTPLPPYIRQARKQAGGSEGVEDPSEGERYQTVYADPARAASVAAPTAGLHFTPGLLERVRGAGVRTAGVVLHVGMGTFKPVETEFVEEHPVHAEWCEVPAETGKAIAEARGKGGRVIAVGTTTARALESFASEELERGASGWTRVLVTPPHVFRNLDGLMTNFHLPRSTLLAMVAALFPGEAREAVERLLGLYRMAIGEGYRFYSYGDAMLILP